MKVFAIIPSAGIGRRMNSSRPKQYIKILGKEILLITLDQFLKSKFINEIIIPVAPDYYKHTEKLIKKIETKKTIRLVTGGKERQDSVFKAFKTVKAEKGDIVIVHDAARVFIKTKHINTIIEDAIVKKSLIAAKRASDTIKKGDLFVSATLDRNLIWIVQTPQVFEYSILKQAFRNANSEKLKCTDESGLVEAIGKRVYFYETNFENRKITTSEDLKFAKMFFNGGK